MRQITIIKVACLIAALSFVEIGSAQTKGIQSRGISGGGARRTAPPVTLEYANIGPDSSIIHGVYQSIHGIFVGVEEYQNLAKLPGAKNDATDSANALSKLMGITHTRTLVNRDATIEAFKDALIDVAAKDGSGDLLVIYFSGRTSHVPASGPHHVSNLQFHDTSHDGVGEGTITVLQLQSLLQKTGVEAKHVLLLIDGAFSGYEINGAELKKTEKNKIKSGEAALQHRAFTIITAGGSATDSDLVYTPRIDGRGVIATQLPGVLRSAQSSDQAADVKAQRYLWASSIQGKLQKKAISSATGVLQKRLDATKIKGGKTHSVSRLGTIGTTGWESLRGNFLEAPFLEVVGAWHSLNAASIHNIQPVEVMIPVVPQRKQSTETATPTPSVASVEATGWDTYLQAVQDTYEDSDYTQAMREVLSLLVDGRPPIKDGVSTSVEAAIFARPFAGDEEQLAELERRGIDWQFQPERGAHFSENFAMDYRLQNNGDSPVYYYLVAIDQAGMIVWVMPENTASEGRSFGTPTGTLSGGESIALSNYTNKGQPIHGHSDMTFFMVVSHEKWSDLENALENACTIASEILDNKDHPKHNSTLEPMGATEMLKTMSGGTTRSPGKLKFDRVKKDGPGITGEIPIRYESDFFVRSWMFDILPAESLIPTVTN